jgi:hypothetical protein
MADKLIVEMVLDPKLDSSGKKKIEKEAGKAGKKSGDKFEKEFKKETSGISDGLKSSLKGLGVAIAAVGVGRLISQSIDLAKRQEDAINGLNVALQITGKFSAQASQQIQDLASEIQQSTRFGDEELLETASLIQQLGNLTVDELGEATKATADLAAALRIDLTSAATLVGKAAGGNVSSFSRYGVAIKTGATNAETFSNTLIALKKFSGAAAGQTNTFAGVVDQLGNTFGDTLEEVGNFIIKNQALTGALKGGLSFLNDFAGGLKGIRVGLLGIKDAPTTELEELDAAIASNVDKLTMMQESLAKTKEGWFGGFLTAGDKAEIRDIPPRIDAINAIMDKQIAKRKELLAVSATGAGDDGASDSVEKLLSREQLLAQVKLQNDERIKESALARSLALAELHERDFITDTEFNASLLQIETEQTEALMALDRKKQESAINASNNISGAFMLAAKNNKMTAMQIGKTMNDLAIKGFGNAMKNIGAALATGKNANQAFVDSAKATAGEAASAFGDYYIKVGVAEVAATKGKSGWGTIAGGSALKVFAGAISAGGSSSSG